MKDNFVNRQAVSKSERLRLLREFDKAHDDWANDLPTGKVRIVWLSYASRDESAYLITEKEYDFDRDQLIPPQNLSAYVSYDGKFGLVDMDGREIAPCKYDAVGTETRGRRWMQFDGRWRVFDIASRHFIGESYTGEYALGCLLVQRSPEGKFGALDFSGEIAVPFEYENIELMKIGPFTESWRFHIIVLTVGTSVGPDKKTLFKLATPDGRLYSEEIYDEAPYQWEFGKFYPCTDWTWTTYGSVTITRRGNGKEALEGLLNVKTGKLVIPCQCTWLAYFGHILDVDLYRFTIDGICSVVDENGKVIIPRSMLLSGIGKMPEDANEYLIPACRDGKWGYINIEAVEKIPFKYDFAGEFSNGTARVSVRGDEFTIDRHGRFVPDMPGGG